MAQEKIEGQQQKKATEDVLVKAAKTLPSRWPVPDPKERRAKTRQREP